mmetsp:Transcript_75954/g.217520  ORF Transcript_75954/g.217520 Transcript_75954/m.217520 type:complete len:354 (+) Transcript_75954:1584-2645(+)
MRQVRRSGLAARRCRAARPVASHFCGRGSPGSRGRPTRPRARLPSTGASRSRGAPGPRRRCARPRRGRPTSRRCPAGRRSRSAATQAKPFATCRVDNASTCRTDGCNLQDCGSPNRPAATASAPAPPAAAPPAPRSLAPRGPAIRGLALAATHARAQRAERRRPASTSAPECHLAPPTGSPIGPVVAAVAKPTSSCHGCRRWYNLHWHRCRWHGSPPHGCRWHSRCWRGRRWRGRRLRGCRCCGCRWCGYRWRGLRWLCRWRRSLCRTRSAATQSFLETPWPYAPETSGTSRASRGRPSCCSYAYQACLGTRCPSAHPIVPTLPKRLPSMDTPGWTTRTKGRVDASTKDLSLT